MVIVYECLNTSFKYLRVRVYFPSFVSFITGRNEVVAKVMFYRHLWFCPRGGGVSASVHVGIPPPIADTPGSRHPPGADTHWSRHPPEQTNPLDQTAPRANTPWSRCPPQQTTPPEQTNTPPRSRHPPEEKSSQEQTPPSLGADTLLPGSRHPPEQTQPLGEDTPQSRHAPKQTPPGADTAPPGADTPPWVDPPLWEQTPPPPPPPRKKHSPRSKLWHTVNERPVRILLECILVLISFALLQTCNSSGKGFYGKLEG